MQIRSLFLFLFLVACSPLETLNAVTPKDNYTAHADIVYGTLPRQKLDIYVPRTLQEPARVIIFYYGGSWQSGTKKDYGFVAQALVARGFLVVIPDYRIVPEARYPVFLQDSALALRWVHDNISRYKGDPQNLFLMGHSAGAYNAMMITFNETYLSAVGGNRSWIKGAIGIAGPYDFLPIQDPAVQEIFAPAGDLALTQPINHVTQKMPPVFLATGDADNEVLPRNTLRLATKLREYGSPVVEKIYPGLGHIGILLEFAAIVPKDTRIVEDVANFMNSR